MKQNKEDKPKSALDKSSRGLGSDPSSTINYISAFEQLAFLHFPPEGGLTVSM